MRFEPIIEVTQIKGDGESHPFLSPDDEFADFENMDKGNLPGTAAKTPEMLPGEYARSALKRGLEIEAQIGLNPYKFGLTGATDAHNAIPSSREENFFGKAHIVEPTETRADYVMVQSPVSPDINMLSPESSASGLTAVWARENTRESIFDAMERKEVYATTGTRIRVRVFGGWDFDVSEVNRPDFAREGYSRGVPMGGDLTAAPAGKAPGFMIRALRDPDGANLDRIQVIKGWVDSDGEVKERIYDVAVSDDRKIDKDGRCKKSVGSTVDLANASYTNTIGEPLFSVYWQDPDFNASQAAFYYVRVIEIPTPRWTAYDVKRLGSKFPEGTKMTIQDRAYTSPIWYTPAK
jgi:ribosome-associated protein YbcJ (S4-like RNA binding protein)